MMIRYSNHASRVYRGEHDEDNPYVMVSNKVVRDRRLSLLAKGIMLELLSNSDTWVTVKSELFKRSGVGRVSFGRAWDELKETGYLEIVQKQGGWEYIITESPVAPYNQATNVNVSSTDVL